jgi:putative ABC transport system ATP-binding protein
MIELRSVTKTYGRGPARVEALRGIDLCIQAGEFVSIMGPSGSGKSTLLNLVSALDAPCSGTITIDGVRTDQLDDDALTLLRRRKIGLIFQFFNLLPTLNACDNVLLPLMLERKTGPEDRRRARGLLSDVGLGARSEHHIHQLSGGEMQRVAIARALMLEPRVILADEPTGNLDTETGANILRLLKKRCEDTGTTLVMVTHDLDAARVGDRLVRVKDGRLVVEEPMPRQRSAGVV